MPDEPKQLNSFITTRSPLINIIVESYLKEVRNIEMELFFCHPRTCNIDVTYENGEFIFNDFKLEAFIMVLFTNDYLCEFSFDTFKSDFEILCLWSNIWSNSKIKIDINPLCEHWKFTNI